jgi:serine/threonine-protein kinase
MNRTFLKYSVGPIAALVLSLGTSLAAAQGGNQAAAEALFQEGRALQEQQRYAEACPKLAESQRIDPATGTLLTLALCYEGEGKLASAWAAFVTVEGEAKAAGRADRETMAREHAAALRPRLSTMAVDVPKELAETPGLELRIAGAVVGTGSFGVAVPVDGGEHRIEATAPGKKPWQTTVSVKTEADVVRVGVPPLEDLPKAAAPVGVTPSGSGAEVEPPRDGSGMRTAGIIVAGVGVAALGVGTYLAFDAKSDHDAAKKRCQPSPVNCEDGAVQVGEDARGQGTIATVLFVAGGAAVATGGVLWLVAPRQEVPAPRAAGLRLERVGVGPRGIVLRGSF